ncbi:Engulfment and cell motility protein 1 [Heterocephalus glaber]|uniref:Engulfment and cell motility protein 1 n=1 Tax=Heterocephalus glaber TaxID=10181 RepID=G5B3V9_HETGA|nr:Engulfment and cell motility protein 1 [Heterocephalus glaber]
MTMKGKRYESIQDIKAATTQKRTSRTASESGKQDGASVFQKKPLSAIIKEVCDGWSLANHEYFALQHADSSNFYITEKNRNEIKNGTILRLTTSPAQNAQQLHERIQSSSMDAKLEALKDLASLSRDVTFAQEFINLDGISLLTQMVESGTERYQKLQKIMKPCFGDMLSFTLTAFVELMDHGIVSWDTFSVAFIKKIASFVNKSAMDISILQRSLAILESMVLNSHDLYQKVAQEITIGQLIPHLQGTDQEIQTYTIAVINALFLKAPDERRQEMANILAQKQLRSIILTHVIRAQRAINNEMAHQLYVLQVLTFNLLEDRMMTKMDPQDQAQRDIIFELRRIAFDAETEPNNSGGSMEKRKSMYTRDYKKLGFINLHLKVPKANSRSQKTYSSEVKDLCHQAEGSTLEPGSDAHSEDQSSPDRTAAIPRDSEAPSSSSNENSLVCIRKTICSGVLLENQQAKSFLSSSLFMAIGNSLQNHVNPAMDFTQTPPGMLALDNMLYFAKHHQDAYIRIVLENSSREDKHECPFGRSSIELTKMLCEILKVGELRKYTCSHVGVKLGSGPVSGLSPQLHRDFTWTSLWRSHG